MKNEEIDYNVSELAIQCFMELESMASEVTGENCYPFIPKSLEIKLSSAFEELRNFLVKENDKRNNRFKRTKKVS